mmetsp:Transcript_31493/g.77153  ORF Transcript_31493/g.77153 Transcript_31493/m.77153 type:complete len:257 (+) Transcript_31493:146-916(+)
MSGDDDGWCVPRDRPLLKEMNAVTKALTPCARDFMDNEAAKKKAAGYASLAVQVGEQAPDIQLVGVDGKDTTLYEILGGTKVLSVVVSFYLGAWCPYCNILERRMHKLSALLRKTQAQIVTVYPEKKEEPGPVPGYEEDLFLQFDSQNMMARKMGIVVALSPAEKEAMCAHGVDIAERNGGGGYELPMPSTFVIDRHRSVRYAFVSEEHGARPEPAELLAVANGIRTEAQQFGRHGNELSRTSLPALDLDRSVRFH